MFSIRLRQQRYRLCLYVSMLFCLALLKNPYQPILEITPSSPAQGVYARSFSKEVSGSIVYVKKDANGSNSGETWDDAFNSLQDGLDASSPWTEIWVAEGVYTPTLKIDSDPRSATFSLKQQVAIFGGFTGDERARIERDWRDHPTTLSGDLAGDDDGFSNNSENSYHVVTALDVDQNATLDGFIIQGGNANNLSAPHNSGGGLYIKSANPVLANLVLTGNNANQGGGIYAKDSSMLIVDCAWIGNQADFGGSLMNSTSSPTIVNAIFDGNYARTLAGGLYNLLNSEPIIINASFANNYDTYGANTIHNTWNTDLEVWNSIIWAASGGHFKNEEGSTTTLSYSIIRGGCSGISGLSCVETLDEDPLFRDEDGEDDVIGNMDDDLRLNSSSPAIDHGDNSIVPPDTVDLDDDGNLSEPLSQDCYGAPRFMDTFMEDLGSGTPPLVDMGAFETYNQVFLPVVKKAGSF